MPRVGDADFTIDRLIARANDDLAHGLGNLVNRVISMIQRYRNGIPPAHGEPAIDAARLTTACAGAPELVHDALAAHDFRRATAAVWSIVEEANRYVEHVRPWELARSERAGDLPAARPLDAALGVLLHACECLAKELTPFLPTAATRIAEQCTATAGRLPVAQPLFPRI